MRQNVTPPYVGEAELIVLPDGVGRVNVVKNRYGEHGKMTRKEYAKVLQGMALGIARQSTPFSKMRMKLRACFSRVNHVESLL